MANPNITALNNAYAGHDGLHYLWHLQAIGLLPPVLDAGTEVKDWSCELGPAQKVAVIDNGCGWTHPNLPAARIEGRMDYAHYIEGARFPDSRHGPLPGIAVDVARLDAVGLDAAQIAAWVGVLTAGITDHDNATLAGAMLAMHGPGGPQPVLVEGVPDPSDRFASHGTACAGLVAGSVPEEFPLPLADAGDVDSQAEKSNPWAMAYTGVNPTAHVVPINTAYDHSYWPVIMGLLWAVSQGATTILMPRGVSDMEELPNGPGAQDPDDPRISRLTNAPHLAAQKQVFEEVLATVSAAIPVVVAAGNDGRDRLQYPARLVTGPCPELIVVGSVTSRGRRASYSSGAGDVTVHAPSDDAERIDTHYWRFEERDWRGRQLSMGEPHGRPQDYSPMGVLAIDIPGSFGYASYDDTDDLEYNDPQVRDALRDLRREHQPGALYTVFGGTSAASSIVAGVVSLMQTKAEGKLTGAEAKAIVTASVTPAPDFHTGDFAGPGPHPEQIETLIDAAAALAATPVEV